MVKDEFLKEFIETYKHFKVSDTCFIEYNKRPVFLKAMMNLYLKWTKWGQTNLPLKNKRFLYKEIKNK